MPLLPYETIHETIRAVLLAMDCLPDDADLLATICTDNSCAGVESHGVHWFPGLLGRIDRGVVDVRATPAREASLGALERWDGRRGPGPITAVRATDRACELADQFGLGGVAVRNTNHWARPGWYGQHAAQRGYGFLCWTNTPAVMPTHERSRRVLGNNPLVVALPGEPAPVLVDIAMSQFSMGRLNEHRHRREPLPYVGGYDADGELTTDAAAILETGRVLPAGLWKGAALSFALDVLAAAVAGGQVTAQIDDEDISQLYLAFRVDAEEARRVVRTASEPLHDDGARYPGEGAQATYRKRREEGIPVRDGVWEAILARLGGDDA